MKLTFECKLTMFEYIPDEEVERVRTEEEVAEAITAEIKGMLFYSGGVSITDATLTKEDGGQDG